MKELVEKPLTSKEPSVRYKVLTGVLGTGPRSRAVRETQEEIRRSRRVRDLLSERNAEAFHRSTPPPLGNTIGFNNGSIGSGFSVPYLCRIFGIG